MPLTALLDAAAAAHPTRPALAFLGTRVTWRDLRETVDRFATALQRLGVRPGDRVAMVLPTCPQQVIAFLATLRLGGVVVEQDPLSPEPQLERQLRDSGAQVVVCLDRALAALQAVVGCGRTDVRHVVVASLVDYLPPVDKLKLRLPLASARRARSAVTVPVPADSGALLFVDILRAARLGAAQAAVGADDPALLQYATGARPGREVTLAAWLRTGDVAVIDADGAFSVMDRTTERRR